MRAVVFDMDGILFDTERLCEDSWVAIAKKWGLPRMEEIFPQCIGLNANDSKRIVLKAYGEDFDYQGFREQASAWYWDYVEKNGLPVMPGAERLLRWLKERGWVVGLASSTRRPSVLKNLELSGFSDYFSAVVTGDMVEHSKPLPDIYLIACRELGVDPKEAYAIEDSPNGIRSAHAAGMRALMVPDMLKPDEEMKRLSYRIMENLDQVLEFFAAQEAEDFSTSDRM